MWLLIHVGPRGIELMYSTSHQLCTYLRFVVFRYQTSISSISILRLGCVRAPFDGVEFYQYLSRLALFQLYNQDKYEYMYHVNRLWAEAYNIYNIMWYDMIYSFRLSDWWSLMCLGLWIGRVPSSKIIPYSTLHTPSVHILTPFSSPSPTITPVA